MLDKFRLIRLITSLCEARKGVFEITCRLSGVTYNFCIDRYNSISVTITNEENGAQVVSSYETPELIKIPSGKYKVLTIKETILTQSRKVYSETKINCTELIQIYLPVFRVLGEQVVFILGTKNGIKKMYFINGRVFYTDVDENSITLHQTDLRKVLNDFPNSEILHFERLPERYSYSNIHEECRQKSVKEGKSWNLVKKGVVV